MVNISRDSQARLYSLGGIDRLGNNDGKFQASELKELENFDDNEDGQLSREEIQTNLGVTADEADKILALYNRAKQSRFDPNTVVFNMESGVRESVQAATQLNRRGADTSVYRQHYANGSQPLGDRLNTPAGRLAILSKLTQIDRLNSTQNDGDRCGPACIVAGVLQHGGKEGLIKLAQAVDRLNQNGSRLQNLGMGEIIEKLRNGTATMDDLSRLQEGLYRVLQASEGDANKSIMANTLANFLESNPEIKNLMAGNIHLVDNSGDGRPNHWVLEFQTPDGPAIYDPRPREDGKQVVTNGQEADLYRRASAGSITIG